MIPDLTPIGEDFFSHIRIAPSKIYITYHKVWVFNNSTKYALNNVQIGIDPASDPNGWITLAKTGNQAPLPIDGNEMNVAGGWGPDTFGAGAVNIGDLPPQNGNSFWVRRAVSVKVKDQQYEAHTFIITGVTTVEGTPCVP